VHRGTGRTPQLHSPAKPPAGQGARDPQLKADTLGHLTCCGMLLLLHLFYSQGSLVVMCSS
jgi:hypothetical protein